MKRIILLVCLVSLLSIGAESGGKAVVEESPQQEGLIILLDRKDSELISGKAGAMTGDFTNALQASVPILVSQSVVINALRRNEIQRGSDAHQAILQKVIKQIGDFYLFIPQEKLGILSKALNIDKLTEISFSSLAPSWEYRFAQARDILARDELLKHAVRRAPLTSILRQLMPTSSTIWSIYIIGHGSSNKLIADLTIQEFQNFLDFCQQHIKTKLLIYSSCYSGGVNLTKAYQESERGIVKTYTFPIIAMSVAEAPTLASRTDDYKKLYELLFRAPDILPDYYTILKDAGLISKVENMPQIRMPGSGWFSVEGLNVKQKNQDYIIISKTQALTRQKPLEIEERPKASGESARIIFVYTPIIPFSIIMDLSFLSNTSANVTYFSFMVPGITYYRFKHIKANRLGLGSIIQMLAGVAKLTDKSYTIYIDELTCLFNEDIFEDLRETTFKNCVLEFSRKPELKEYEVRFIGAVNDQQKTIIQPFSFSSNGFLARRSQEQEIVLGVDYSKKFQPPPSIEEFTASSERLKGILAHTQATGKIAEKLRQRETRGLADILEP